MCHGFLIGAVNGLILGTLVEIALRLLYSLDGYLQDQTPLPYGMSISYAPYPFRWWWFPLIGVIMFAPAATVTQWLFFGHTTRYQGAVIAGCIVIGEFYLFNLVWDLWLVMTSDMGTDYWRYALSNKPRLWVVLIPFVLMFSLLSETVKVRLGDAGSTPIR